MIKLKYIIFLVAVCVAIVMPAFSQAATLYWVGNDGANINVASNWKTTDPASCGGGNASSAPTNADTLIFDADCDNGATFNASITASTGGITISSGYAGTITLTNLTYANPITLQDNATFSVNSTNTGTLSGVISDGAGSFSIIKTGTGTLYIGANSTFDGGVIIKSGILYPSVNANAVGTGSITIGDTTGSANATLSGYTETSFANPIIVAAGSSGTLSISATNKVVYSGAITLNNNFYSQQCCCFVICNMLKLINSSKL